jgi:hypothetical protein
MCRTKTWRAAVEELSAQRATFGHAGIAVRKDSGLMLATDAYFFHTEMDVERPRRAPGLALYQWMSCSHDPIEFERIAGRSAGVPAEAFKGASALPGISGPVDEPARSFNQIGRRFLRRGARCRIGRRPCPVRSPVGVAP